MFFADSTVFQVPLARFWWNYWKFIFQAVHFHFDICVCAYVSTFTCCVWMHVCGRHVRAMAYMWRSVLSFYEAGSEEQTAKLGTMWHLITPYICAFANVWLSYILHSVVFGVPEINIFMPELLSFPLLPCLWLRKSLLGTDSKWVRGCFFLFISLFLVTFEKTSFS